METARHSAKNIKKVGDYYLMEEVGSGMFGSVYYCKPQKKGIHAKAKQRFREGRQLACKRIDMHKLNKKVKKFLKNEIKVMQTIEHPNILRFIDKFKTNNNIYLFFEFCNGGNLKNFISMAGGRMSETLARFIITQIVAGVKYMNESVSQADLDEADKVGKRGIAHRDLKPDNIMLNFPNYPKSRTVPDSYISHYLEKNDKNCYLEDPKAEPMEVIIVDLGLARAFDSTQQDLCTTFCGSLVYMAPEILQGKEYDSKVDIWSIGVILYQLIFGRRPFESKAMATLVKSICNGDYKIPKDSRLTLDMLGIIHKCLRYDPEDRISHSDLMLALEDVKVFEDKSKLVSLSQNGGKQPLRIPHLKPQIL